MDAREVVNIESDVAESFADLGYTLTWTSPALQALIAEHGCVIKVAQVGGQVDRVEGQYRCVIEVFAATYAAMWAAASAITTRLIAGAYRAGPILIDAETCESLFAERPYADGTRVVTSTWVLTVRHNTRLAVVTP